MFSWGDYSFQSGNSPIMNFAQNFHDYMMITLLLIIGLVGVVMAEMIWNKESVSAFSDYSILEIWWTILPGGVLLFIAYPSLRLLYLMDEVETPSLSMNILGHQWYWEYATPNEEATIESYMTDTPGPRLLEVDNRIALPSQVSVRGLVSAVDVLHSWTVPSLGVKVDAVPGRLNQIGLDTMKTGVFHGQCSEICGANHSFMPIVLEVIPSSVWSKWVTLYSY